jgi:hypothetical protein
MRMTFAVASALIAAAFVQHHLAGSRGGPH